MSISHLQRLSDQLCGPAPPNRAQLLCHSPLQVRHCGVRTASQQRIDLRRQTLHTSKVGLEDAHLSCRYGGERRVTRTRRLKHTFATSSAWAAICNAV
jgi:hypothetical protein